MSTSRLIQFIRKQAALGNRDPMPTVPSPTSGIGTTGKTQARVPTVAARTPRPPATQIQQRPVGQANPVARPVDRNPPQPVQVAKVPQTKIAAQQQQTQRVS